MCIRDSLSPLRAQVVVVSADAELRFAACELLLLLLHPFEWAQAQAARAGAWGSTRFYKLPCESVAAVGSATPFSCRRRYHHAFAADLVASLSGTHCDFARGLPKSAPGALASLLCSLVALMASPPSRPLE
eukprot:4729966-Pleurochrysis_carterae.AAC.2